MSSSLRILVTGLIAQHPLLGGVTWDYLQYVLGLARLGHDVYYIEDSGEWPYNLDGGASGDDWVAHDCTFNVGHLAAVMSRFGLGDKWAYRFPVTSTWFGLSDGRRREVVETADLLINVSGTLERTEEYRRVRRLAYVDSDPVFTQVKLVGGDREFRVRVDAHDVHFSFGERLSNAVPWTGHHWRPTRQPIVLPEWRPWRARRAVFTTVMSWTSYKPLVHGGQTYAQKDVELRRFLDLPTRVTPTLMEIALSRAHHVTWETPGGGAESGAMEATPGQTAGTPWELLAHKGWQVVDPAEVCRDLDGYREYIESSMAEWSVAKHGYVVGQPGWFSCRSACYLAAGRPVVVQDTGFASVLPVGEGILSFRTIEQAAAAVRDVTGHYSRHAKAAREIAEEYFDSDKVLGRLVEEALDYGG